ncbi:hypothetical protein BKA93DRAFT_102929 [Sparassis latifolia]
MPRRRNLVISLSSFGSPFHARCVHVCLCLLHLPLRASYLIWRPENMSAKYVDHQEVLPQREGIVGNSDALQPLKYPQCLSSFCAIRIIWLMIVLMPIFVLYFPLLNSPSTRHCWSTRKRTSLLHTAFMHNIPLK